MRYWIEVSKCCDLLFLSHLCFFLRKRVQTVFLIIWLQGSGTLVGNGNKFTVLCWLLLQMVFFIFCGNKWKLEIMWCILAFCCPCLSEFVYVHVWKSVSCDSPVIMASLKYCKKLTFFFFYPFLTDTKVVLWMTWNYADACGSI